MNRKYVKLSKFLSYILRHNPYKYELSLDEKGFTDLNQIINILNNHFKDFKIDKSLLEDLIEASDKKRFQIIDKKIRAYYGHSVPHKIQLIELNYIPEMLYHGTTKKAYQKIKFDGLKRKSRQYVHLSDTIKAAIQVAKRRTNEPIILIINAKNAHQEGIKFYKSGDVYLSNSISPIFIETLSEF
ncbi:MAG: RNA 2'-phosphotransferase [Candidatus Lokiarchaeota archaeon]